MDQRTMSTPRRRFFVLLTLILTLGLSAPGIHGREDASADFERMGALDATVGDGMVISLPSRAKRIALANESLATIHLLSGKELMINGNMPGRTNVFMWLSDGSKRVYELRVGRDLTVLDMAAKRIDPRLTVESSDDQRFVVLGGATDSALVARHAKVLVEQVLAQSSGGSKPPTVLNFVDFPPETASVDDRLQATLNTIDPRISVRRLQVGDQPNFQKDTYVLEGRVKSVADLVRAVTLAERQLGGTGGKVSAPDESHSNYQRFRGMMGGGGGGGAMQALSYGGIQKGGLASQIARDLIPASESGRVISLLKVDELPQILVSIRVYAIDRGNARQLGINWRFDDLTGSSSWSAGGGVSPNPSTLPGLAGGEATIDGITGGNFGFAWVDGLKSLTAAIDALSAQDLARAVAEPNVLTLSGESASVLVGGEVPIPTTTVTQTAALQSYYFQDFGVRLDIRPTMTEDDIVAMEVATSIIRPIGTGSDIEAPAFKIQTVNTTARVPEGRTLVIGGLVDFSEGMEDRWVPGFKWFPLFRWKKNARAETEILFVITPRLVEATIEAEAGLELPELKWPDEKHKWSTDVQPKPLPQDGVPDQFKSSQYESTKRVKPLVIEPEPEPEPEPERQSYWQEDAVEEGGSPDSAYPFEEETGEPETSYAPSSVAIEDPAPVVDTPQAVEESTWAYEESVESEPVEEVEQVSWEEPEVEAAADEGLPEPEAVEPTPAETEYIDEPEPIEPEVEEVLIEEASNSEELEMDAPEAVAAVDEPEIQEVDEAAVIEAEVEQQLLEEAEEAEVDDPVISEETFESAQETVEVSSEVEYVEEPSEAQVAEEFEVEPTPATEEETEDVFEPEADEPVETVEIADVEVEDVELEAVAAAEEPEVVEAEAELVEAEVESVYDEPVAEAVEMAAVEEVTETTDVVEETVDQIVEAAPEDVLEPVEEIVEEVVDTQVDEVVDEVAESAVAEAIESDAVVEEVEEFVETAVEETLEAEVEDVVEEAVAEELEPLDEIEEVFEETAEEAVEDVIEAEVEDVVDEALEATVAEAIESEAVVEEVEEVVEAVVEEPLEAEIEDAVEEVVEADAAQVLEPVLETAEAELEEAVEAEVEEMVDEAFAEAVVSDEVVDEVLEDVVEPMTKVEEQVAEAVEDTVEVEHEAVVETEVLDETLESVDEEVASDDAVDAVEDQFVDAAVEEVEEYVEAAEVVETEADEMLEPVEEFSEEAAEIVAEIAEEAVSEESAEEVVEEVAEDVVEMTEEVIEPAEVDEMGETTEASMEEFAEGESEEAAEPVEGEETTELPAEETEEPPEPEPEPTRIPELPEVEEAAEEEEPGDIEMPWFAAMQTEHAPAEEAAIVEADVVAFQSWVSEFVNEAETFTEADSGDPVAFVEIQETATPVESVETEVFVEEVTPVVAEVVTFAASEQPLEVSEVATEEVDLDWLDAMAAEEDPDELPAIETVEADVEDFQGWVSEIVTDANTSAAEQISVDEVEFVEVPTVELEHETVIAEAAIEAEPSTPAAPEEPIVLHDEIVEEVDLDWLDAMAADDEVADSAALVDDVDAEAFSEWFEGVAEAAQPDKVESATQDDVVLSIVLDQVPVETYTWEIADEVVASAEGWDAIPADDPVVGVDDLGLVDEQAEIALDLDVLRLSSLFERISAGEVVDATVNVPRQE